MQTSNQIQAFDFCGSQVRAHVDANGNSWWVAKDVCDVLGIVNTSQAVEHLDADEKGICTTYTLLNNQEPLNGMRPRSGGEQEMLTVSESGLYLLIFTSRKPEAKAFRRWVTGEVLPGIRKTGGYSVVPDRNALPAPTREDFDRAVADTVQHIIDRHPPNEQPALRDYITVCGHRLNLLPHPHDRVFRYRASEVLALLDLDGNTNPKPRCTKEAQGILRDIAADSRKPDRISLEPWEVATLISRVFCDRRHSIMSHFGIDVGVYSNAKRGCEALIPRLTFSRPDFTAPSSVQEALSTGAAIEVTFPRRADT